ncbi:MAG: fumarylacetoacetate hydrolase family protein [Burkholderiaceae bacterium]|nr:fumarylacetoacetate hydrolase family protein [Burkholderiaceae bacterium]
MNSIESFARQLDAAVQHGQPMAHISDAGDLSLDDAYAIQQAWMSLRELRGDQRVGYKLGFTNGARIKQLGLSGPAVGVLTQSMLLDNNCTVSLAGLNRPRIEPELAFLIGSPLEGKVTPLQALRAIEAVAPAIEIVDTRYREDRFSLHDVIADNCSSVAAVIGAWREMPADLSNLGVTLEFNGRVVQIGSSAAVMGHPGYALVAAVNMLATYDGYIEAGSIIMTGAATTPQALHPGVHARVVVEQLGHVSARFE